MRSLSTEDREILSDIRGTLHGVTVRAGDIENSTVYSELTSKVDAIIIWLKSLDRKTFPQAAEKFRMGTKARARATKQGKL